MHPCSLFRIGCNVPDAPGSHRTQKLGVCPIDFGITGIAAITVLCFLLGQGIKLSPLNKCWIPVICGIFGGLLGIAGMYIIDNFPATDLITAAAVGVVSGLAATGIHQIGKQIKKEH